MKKDAYISNGYRYWLLRYWAISNEDMVCWIMLNPSTADHKEDDPTIRRCVNFSKYWGFGGLLVVNLFAFMATDPKNLFKAQDPIGAKNNYHIKEAVAECKIVVAAWGCHGNYLDRDKEVLKIVPNLMHLKKTKNGFPVHPLYQKKDLQPKPFNPEGD